MTTWSRAAEERYGTGYCREAKVSPATLCTRVFSLIGRLMWPIQPPRFLLQWQMGQAVTKTRRM
jgi:hypothetical protein